MTHRDDTASSADTAPAAEPTFGERFLAELRRLGGSFSGFSYAEIQAIKGCDREGLVEALRAAMPLISYAACNASARSRAPSSSPATCASSRLPRPPRPPSGSSPCSR
jgi:hypothetical protein